MTVPFTLGDTIGAVFLGCVGSAILYGVTILQVFVYYLYYPKDWQFQKISVALLWALDSFHLALTIHGVYHYLIDSFGNLIAEEYVFWSFKMQIAVNVVIIMVVQSLYSVRIWRIARDYSKIWPCLVIVCVVSEFVLTEAVGMMLAVKTYQLNTLFDIAGIGSTVDLSFAYATFVDVVIAASMCFYLFHSKSGFSSTNSKVHQIIKFVVGSGIVTSACSMTALFLYVGMPGNLIFIGVEFLLTKLYVNSYMAMLNARKSIHENDTIVGSTLVGASQRVALSRGTANDKNIDLVPLRSQEAMGVTVYRKLEIRTDSLDSRQF